MPMAELRSRRLEAEQEETDLSYARRMLLGRLDLLLAEQEARQAARARPPRGSDDDIVATLSRVLADAPTKPFGLGRHTRTEPSRVGERRRAVEAAVADPAISVPHELSDDELAVWLARLEELRVDVTALRSAVQEVVDRLSAEVGRRYREGMASVDEVLAAG